MEAVSTFKKFILETYKKLLNYTAEQLATVGIKAMFPEKWYKKTINFQSAWANTLEELKKVSLI